MESHIRREVYVWFGGEHLGNQMLILRYIAGEDRFFYLMCVIDVYDRMIVDYHFGLSCEGKHAAQIIQRAL